MAEWQNARGKRVERAGRSEKEKVKKYGMNCRKTAEIGGAKIRRGEGWEEGDGEGGAADGGGSAEVGGGGGAAGAEPAGDGEAELFGHEVGVVE